MNKAPDHMPTGLDWKPISTAPRAAHTQVYCRASEWPSPLWLSYYEGHWTDEDTNHFEPTMWCVAMVSDD